jgi:hypothetical protein
MEATTTRTEQSQSTQPRLRTLLPRIAEREVPMEIPEERKRYLTRLLDSQVESGLTSGKDSSVGAIHTAAGGLPAVQSVGNDILRYEDDIAVPNSQCIFTSELQPCDFCREKGVETPCLKLKGPKKQIQITSSQTSSHGPSRPIPTAIDAVINAEDVLLLQYLYSLDCTYPQTGVQFGLVVFFKQMAVLYGISIQSPALRHAMLATAASWLPSTEFDDRYQRHIDQASQALPSTITPTTTVTEPDLFATQILAEIAWRPASKPPQYVSARMRADQCFRIMERLLNQNSMSDEFKTVRPFVVDWLNSFSAWMGWGFDNVSRVTFRERLASRVESHRFSGLPASQIQGMEVALAIGYTIGTLVINSLRRMYRIVSNEGDHHQLEKEKVVEQIRAESTDPDFTEGWREILPRTFDRGISVVDLGMLNLLEAIFTAPNILEGLNSPSVTRLALYVLSYFRRVHQITNYGEQFTLAFPPRVLLPALALSSSDIPERNDPNEHGLT